MNLPSQFLQRMEAMLTTDSAAFVESFHRERYSGLRANLLKTSVENFQQIQPFSLEPIPWCESGFYYDAPKELEQGLRPGKHPLHEAGLYYIQEPSAMVVAEVAKGIFSSMEAPRVLDLCGAPGGKSSQLASLLGGKGFLVSNEIVPGRAKILSQNMERMGWTNGVVVNHTPDELSARFPGCFDVIVVDAPCSGEGMFRKDEDTIDQWSPENVIMCGERQKDILEEAVAMLAPGGTLIYSTCTFAPAEDEAIVLWMMRTYPELEVLEANPGLFGPGHPEWVSSALGCEDPDPAITKEEEEAIRKSARLWPQDIKGEGHFLAVFRKTMEPDMDEEWYEDERERTWIGGAKPPKKGKKMKGAHKGYGNQILKKAPPEWKEFAEGFFGEQEADVAWRGALDRICGEGQQFLMFGEQLYAVHRDCPDLSGLTVMRAGLHLGTIKKERFEPSHALALALTTAMIEDLQLGSRCVGLRSEEMATRYLKGEALMESAVAPLPQDGWNVVTYKGYPLGWGKISGGSVKNHYPKGLRWV